MGKVLTRLVLLILIGLVAYLYVQVIDLQRENRQLTAQVSKLAAVETENAALRARIAQIPRGPDSSLQNMDWLSAARDHILNAEQAVGKGNFGLAVKETQDANISLTRAADSASSESRQTVQSLRSQLDQVQTKAKALWSQFS